MGGRSGGSFGKSARPKFEGGRGGMSRAGRLHHREHSGRVLGSLGAAAYRPDTIKAKAKVVDQIVAGLKLAS